MANPVITIEHVDVSAAERTILHDVTCTIEAGELVTLIGPNGAGKSTLIEVVLGLRHDYTGTVTIAPTERIQYLPQITLNDHTALPMSVSEYLKIGTTPLYASLREKFDYVAALEHVGVSPALLSQRWDSLSGGERQRVAIARALLSKPTMLILDEPLAAIDFHSRDGLYELLRHLQQAHNMTVLLVSHDIDSVLPISDRLLCLNQTLHTDCHPSQYHKERSSAPLVHHQCS